MIIYKFKVRDEKVTYRVRGEHWELRGVIGEVTYCPRKSSDNEAREELAFAA
ncbi:hypothetical protein HYZ97_04425 [Candidatus Pacearchaeota archaeon]|nr:hypothetical protein [Candidatus Pacearchaeota archaeon]